MQTEDQKTEQHICRGPSDYDADRDGTATFYLTDAVSYPCFPLMSTWNGFDNVEISVQTRDLIAADVKAAFENDLGTVDDFMSIEPSDNGRICLGWGYATQLDEVKLPVVPVAPTASEEKKS